MRSFKPWLGLKRTGVDERICFGQHARAVTELLGKGYLTTTLMDMPWCRRKSEA